MTSTTMQPGMRDRGDTDDTSLPDDLIELIEKGVPPQDDLSAAFHHAVCWLGDLRLVGGAHRTSHRRQAHRSRALRKTVGQGDRPLPRKKAGTGRTTECAHGVVALDDFYAFMPRHSYIFVPTREMWPGSSVNSRLPKVPLKKKDGMPVVDKDGNPKHSRPSDWLDKHKPIEQMTWAPGEPLTIRTG